MGSLVPSVLFVYKCQPYHFAYIATQYFQFVLKLQTINVTKIHYFVLLLVFFTYAFHWPEISCMILQANTKE